MKLVSPVNYVYVCTVHPSVNKWPPHTNSVYVIPPTYILYYTWLAPQCPHISLVDIGTIYQNNLMCKTVTYLIAGTGEDIHGQRVYHHSLLHIHLHQLDILLAVLLMTRKNWLITDLE